MSTEKFTASDCPSRDRMNELGDMFKTFDLRDRAHMLNLLTMGEHVDIYAGSLGKYQISFEVDQWYLNGCCLQGSAIKADLNDLSDDPFIKTALDAYLQENNVSDECYIVGRGVGHGNIGTVGVFTSKTRAFNAAIRYAEKHGEYTSTPITKDDFEVWSTDAKGEPDEWKIYKKDLCLDVFVEKHKTNFLQG